MPVTNANLMALFAGSGNRPAFTIAQRTKVLAALTASINPVDTDDEPRAATNEDLADWLYDYMVSNTLGHLRQQAGNNITF